MLAAVASMPQPERRPSPTALPAAAEPDLSPEVVAAVHECLRVLAAAGDLGHDTVFVGAQAAKASLLPAGARTCRKLLARHRELLPQDLAAVAMGEVEPEVPDLAEPVAAPAEPAAKRKRGRPAKGATAMTAAERNRAWRSNKNVVALEVPGTVADRLRAARTARGESMADLLTAALDALDCHRAARLTA